MDSKYSLKPGDIVAVNFNNAQITLFEESNETLTKERKLVL